MGKNCSICGKASGMYPLCKEHMIMKNAGKVAKCSDCGEWFLTDNACKCKKVKKYTTLPSSGFTKCILCNEQTDGYAFCHDCWEDHTDDELLDILNTKCFVFDLKNDTIKSIDSSDSFIEDNLDNKEEVVNKVIVIDENNRSKCITCGKHTEGLLFCAHCYGKYKKKELLFKITNCTNVELLDEDYEGRYTCKDGHVVKSKSERDIDNYLFEHGISHAYERELPYGATSKEVLHPDFYLPNYLGIGKHVYIEHWGYNENNIQYTKTKKFKLPIYERLGITLVCTYEKTDMNKIDGVLDRKLNKNNINENKINYKE